MQPVLQYQWRGEHVDKDRKVKGGKGGNAAKLLDGELRKRRQSESYAKKAQWKAPFRYVKSDFLVYDWLFSLFISDIFVNMNTRSQKHLDDHDEGDEVVPSSRNEAVSSPQVEIVVAYSHFFFKLFIP